MLHMTYKYAASAGQDGDAKSAAFLAGVLANANRGGENVATGTLQGAIMGGACGYSKLPQSLLEGLSPTDRENLDKEVDAFLASIPLLSKEKDDEHVASGSL